MKTPHDRLDKWTVNVPLSDLLTLTNQLDSMDGLKKENAQLRREMDGMRQMFSELQTAFGELRRELKGR